MKDSQPVVKLKKPSQEMEMTSSILEILDMKKSI